MPVINGREDKIFAPVEAVDGRLKLCFPCVSLRIRLSFRIKYFSLVTARLLGTAIGNENQVERVGNRFFEPLPARIHLLARFQLLSFQELPVSRKNVSRRVKTEGEKEKEKEKNNRDVITFATNIIAR